MPNILDQLADLEVPPPPAHFDAQLHQRVNRSLLNWQLIDLVVGAVPFAVVYFAKALVGFVTFTVTGRYEASSKKSRR